MNRLITQQHNNEKTKTNWSSSFSIVVAAKPQPILLEKAIENNVFGRDRKSVCIARVAIQFNNTNCDTIIIIFMKLMKHCISYLGWFPF